MSESRSRLELVRGALTVRQFMILTTLLQKLVNSSSSTHSKHQMANAEMSVFLQLENELTCTHAHTHNNNNGTQVHELAYSSTRFLLRQPALSRKEFPFHAFHLEVCPMSLVLSHYPSAKHQGHSGHSIVHHNRLTQEQVCLCGSCSEL